MASAGLYCTACDEWVNELTWKCKCTRHKNTGMYSDAEREMYSLLAKAREEWWSQQTRFWTTEEIAAVDAAWYAGAAAMKKIMTPAKRRERGKRNGKAI